MSDDRQQPVAEGDDADDDGDDGDDRTERVDAGVDPTDAGDDGDDATESAPAGLGARITHRIKRIIPVASLAVGIAGAVMMDRGPERAVIVAWATIGAWLALAATQWLGRAREEDGDGARPLHVRALRYSSLMATQSLVQLSLFFALPFFLRAMSLDPAHLIFMVALCTLCAVSLWDPWSEALLGRPLLSAVMPAAGTFVVLVAVLPGVGLSTSVSLWLAALATVAGVPLVAAATAPPRQRRLFAGAALGVAMLLPLSLYLGAARFIPPAPLRLVKAEIGTQVKNKWVTDPTDHFETPPALLVCATAIGSPLGLHDEMFHVWSHGGKELARIGLDIVGGRDAGYRTRSRFRGFKRDPTGTYTCRVETRTGQLLGATSVTLGQ